MNYYQHHIGDFRAGTRNMSFIERAAFRELIEEYYDTEAPLPPDIETVCRKIGVREQGMREAVEYVLAEKFILTADGFRNQRCDDEIAKYRAFGESQSQKGKASALARAAKKAAENGATAVHPNANSGKSAVKPLHNTGSTTVNHGSTTVEFGSTNQEPITKNQEPPTKNQSESESPYAPAPIASRLPSDWHPSPDLRIWTVERAIGFSVADLTNTREKFIAHHQGAGSIRADWDAAWRKWVLDEVERRSNRGASPDDSRRDHGSVASQRKMTK